MLTFEQIKQYFSPELARLNPKGMIVEYLQYEFLDSLYKQAGAEKMSFIGGTAIRIIYNSRRFSEDLDFDNYGLSYGLFEQLMRNVFSELKIKGFEIESRIFKKGKVFHAYIKFPSILKEYGLSSHHQEKIFVAVDAEQKKKLAENDIKNLNKFGIFRNIVVNKAPVLLAQKLMAILQRKRERGRDFYDVSFLGGMVKPDYDYIKASTGLIKEEFRENLIKRCVNFDYKMLSKDAMPFLFDPEQKNRILEFNDNLQNCL